MTVGQMKKLLGQMADETEMVVCITRCEEIRSALAGGDWVVVSGYFDVDRVRNANGIAVLYAVDDVG